MPTQEHCTDVKTRDPSLTGDLDPGPLRHADKTGFLGCAYVTTAARTAYRTTSATVCAWSLSISRLR
jgi:hypothetical protein